MKKNKQGFSERKFYNMWRICPKTGFKEYGTFLHRATGWKLSNITVN